MTAFVNTNNSKMQRKVLFFLLFALFTVTLAATENFSVEYFGDRQTGRVNQPLKDEVVVIVTDSEGKSVEQVEVEFYALTNKLSLSDKIVFTDDEGKAGISVVMGETMGDYELGVRVHLDDNIISHNYVFTAFDYKKLAFYLFGGLGLFLFGIKKISESLRIVAGDNLRRILAKLTANRFLGVGVGLTITALLQSSSATTVMTIGFVNASLLTLRQAIAVIVGANIGTTVTAQIIAFKIGEIALPAIAIGSGIVIFSKRLKMRSYGSIILGFGLVFFGLNIMTDIVGPIRSSVYISDFFAGFSKNYLLAILAGTIMTMLVQSSSATVGITMVLGVSGLIDIYTAMALVLGDNIGTTITAVLASIGSSVNARRTALSHVFFNTIGAAYMVLLLYIFGEPIARLMASISGDISRQIANFHTMFNVFNTLMFIPLIPLLARVVTKIVPDEIGDKERITTYISDTLLDDPGIAVDQIKLELGNMMQNASRVIDSSMKSLDSINRLHIDDAFKAESDNDKYQLEITDFIAKLSRQELSEDIANRLPVLLHLTNDLEKVADFAKNIAEIAERKLDREIEFSDVQKRSLERMKELLFIMLENLLLALENNDQAKARLVAEQEVKMNHYEIRFKKQQIKDITAGKPVEPAIMTMDVITNIEKAGDHLYNVAQAVMGALSEDKKALYSDLLINKTTLKGSCCP
jgi:phosphate:Na+ symporter